MSYIGNEPNYQNFAVQTEDGGDANYTLDYTPGTQDAVLVFVDGVHQKPGTDYTISGSTLTPVSTFPAGTGNVAIVFLGRQADIGTPSDDTVSTAKLVDEAVTEGKIEASVLTKSRPQSGTVQATTSGTSIDFTSIPSWAKKITVCFVGVSTNGSSVPIVQIGDSGGIENTGYLGTAGHYTSAAQAAANYTTGFGTSGSVGAATIIHGLMVLVLTDAAANTWAMSFCGAHSDQAAAISGGGSKSLSGTLDRLRLTTVGGTDTFDAGKVNILYE